MRVHILAAILPLLVLGCPSETPAVCDNGACDPNPDGSSPDGSSSGGGDAGNDVAVPPGCDANADPKDAPKCVVSSFGIFVDGSNGSDANSGTKESPVKTIGAALTKANGKQRIYVCEGTYPESVKLTSPISIFGGFACGTWTYTGVHSKVAPGVAGAEALVIENVKSGIVLSDMHADAAPGDATKKNSIAMRIVASTDVKLVRVKATAGAGFKGAPGTAGTTGTLTAVSSGAMSQAGNPAATTTPGALKTCTCSIGGTTSGGTGGAPNGPGQAGAPTRGGTAPNDGAGGGGAVACNPGGFGSNGAEAPAAAHAPALPTSNIGTLENGVWTPANGERGTDGLTGQGGGGGGGRDSASAGGGGACGGCGGSGGGGGAGGGASIAILAVDAAIALNASTLTPSNGGDGGAGASGGTGGTGGAGASGGPTGCQAGEGGNGGSGGAGAGGAGGISVGILWKGIQPTRDDATNVAITIGAAGAAGAGGASGTNDGPVGKAEKVMGL